MNRASSLISRVLNTALLLALAGLVPSFAATATKPNIVLIMAEDIGNDLACYGTPGVETPTLDRMAREGIQYNRFYNNSPICSPSRTALMLGMYQTSSNGHNHRSNVAGSPGWHYLTHYLREAGYINLLGSELLALKSGKLDINVKLDETMFDKSPRQPGQPFFQQIQLQGTHRQAEDPRWQELRASKADPVDPAAVSIPPYLPDTPEVRLDWATYLDQIEQADTDTQSIIDDLAKRGELDHTIIIWIGDNGRCQIRGKGYLYEDGIKCPLIIWGKGIGRDRVVNDLVSGIDLTATILALAGVPLPDQMQGQAFLANPSYKANESIFAARDRWDEVVDCSRTVVEDRFKYIYNFMPEVPYDANQSYLNKDNVRPILPLLREMNRHGKLTPAQAYFFAPRKEIEQLYDLKNDPWELTNLAPDPAYQTIKLRLNRKLFATIRATNDQGLEITASGEWRPKLEADNPHAK